MRDNTDILKKKKHLKNHSKKEKALTLKNAIILLHGRQKVLNAAESKIFPKRKQGEELQ